MDASRSASSSSDRVVGAAGESLTPEAFAARFADAWPLLRSIAAGVLGRSEQASDVVQDAAMIALQKLDTFEDGTSFTAWMGQIVRYTALNAGRRGARRRGVAVDPQIVAEIAVDTPPVADAPLVGPGELRADQHAFDDQVLAALGALDETARVCLLLRTLHDVPYRDLARLLEIPEGTAMSHVHRARKAMREMLAHADVGRSKGDAS